MAHLDDLVIRIKAMLDSGGFDQAANKVRDVGDTANRASNDLAKMGNDGRSSFMQMQYGANSSLSSVNRDLQSVNSTSSSLWGNLKSGATSAWSSIKDGASSAWSSIKDGASSAASSISSTLSSIKGSIGDAINSVSGIEGAMTGVMGGIGLSQVGDIVVGTSMKAETNKVLLKNMTQTAQGADTLYKTVDNATNKTLVSMQSVIPALNKFKASTGANEQTLTNVTDKVANFGSYVYAMTGSAALADTAMMDLTKGIDGAFASIDQYGITEKSLMNTGLWSGKADDVEGYMAAVEAVIGNTDELMNTTQGMWATFQKSFSIAGKKIGEWILPVIKSLFTGFSQLNDLLGGNLAPAILLVVGAISLLATGLGILGVAWPAIVAGAGMFGGAITFLTGALGINTGVTATAVGAAAAHATALGVETGATVAAETATWGLNAALLANPAFWVVAAIMALAAAVIYLKTQTDLLSSVSDRAGKSMQTLNNRLEMLKGQSKAAENHVQSLKNKLDTLDKNSAEYKTVYENYLEEKSKLYSIKQAIAEINGTKATYSVQIQKAELDSYNRTKVDPKKLETAQVTQYTSGDPQNISNIQKAGGQLAYYNSLANKSTKTFNGLSDAQLKTFDGKRLGQYSQKMSEVADLETKINKDISEGKSPDWLDQAKLSQAKNELDKMAGINPWDDEKTRIAKRNKLAMGDTTEVDGSAIEEKINKWFEDTGKYLEGCWSNTEKWFSDGAKWIGDGFNKAIDDAGAWINGAWENTQKWFENGKTWITNGFNQIKQIILNGAANLTKNIPVIGDFFENLSSNGGDVGAAIKKTIDDIDWAGLGSDVGGKLIEGIKGMIESMPIIGDIMKLLEGDGGNNSKMLTEDQKRIGDPNALPQLNWSDYINPNNWGNWLSRNNWSSWLNPNNWSTWLKVNSWSSWLSKNSWTSWISKISWSSFITPVNLANYVLGAFGAGGDEVGAGGDIDTSSVSSSSVSTKNSYVKKSKTSSKKINVVNHNTFNLEGDKDVVQKVVDELFKQVEARG